MKDGDPAARHLRTIAALQDRIHELETAAQDAPPPPRPPAPRWAELVAIAGIMLVAVFLLFLFAIVH